MGLRETAVSFGGEVTRKATFSIDESLTAKNSAFWPRSTVIP